MSQDAIQILDSQKHFVQKASIKNGGFFPCSWILKEIDSLVEIWLWDLDISTLSDGFDGEDEGLSSEHSELAHHLPRVGHKQADGLLLVNHSLVDMQTTWQDKVETCILKERRRKKKEGRKMICLDYIHLKLYLISVCFHFYYTLQGKVQQIHIKSRIWC